MNCQKRTLTISYHVKARLDLVYFGIQQSLRNSIRYNRYSSRMACDLEPTCNFLFGFSSCTLPEDTTDVDITVCTLKGIHTFRKDQSMHISRCSPWGIEVKPFHFYVKENGLH